MSTDTQPASPSLANLPTEILLETISLVPYTPSSIQSLQLVCRRFDAIVRNYEHSIAGSIIRNNFPHQTLRKFPSVIQKHGDATYATVGELTSRLQVLHDIEKSCYDIRERAGKQAGWMETRWIQLQGVGLLLLYRLHDCGGREEQAAFLRSLPYTSLATLLCTLMISIQQLRADGPDILHHQSPVQVRAFRVEIELACQELLLERGPEYLGLLLKSNSDAIKVLDTEYAQMDARQLPDEDGRSRPITLIAQLRIALVTSQACRMITMEDHHHMCRLLHGDRFKTLFEENAEKIVRGEAFDV